MGGLEWARGPLKVFGQALEHGAVDAFGQGAHMERELGIRIHVAKARTEGGPDRWGISFGDAEAMAATQAREGNNATIRGPVCAKIFKGSLGQPDHRKGGIWSATIGEARFHIEALLARGAVKHGKGRGRDADHEVEAGRISRWGARHLVIKELAIPEGEDEIGAFRSGMPSRTFTGLMFAIVTPRKGVQ